MYKKEYNCSTEKKKKTNKSPVRPGKILQTNDHMGKSVPGKMFMTRGFKIETPALVEILPIYTKCTSCQMFLGSKEIDLADVLDENSVDVIITSPPFFQQRVFDDATCELGQEASVEEYAANLVTIFAECERVLKPTGTFYLNLGDTYKDGRKLQVPDSRVHDVLR